MTTGGAPHGAPGWTGGELEQRSDWRVDFRDFPDLPADLARLDAWRASVPEPVQALQADTLELPAVQAIGQRISPLVRESPGLALLTHAPPLAPELLALLYLAIGLELGSTVDVYGRLYEVRDRGGSYKDSAIPVSMTRESTGIHTDSSNRAVWPRIVALACVNPSTVGGASRMVSVHRVHHLLGERAPELRDRLYGDYIRDVVTPGSDRSESSVRANRFPIFARGDRVTLRYMRYWIERGHDRVSVPLTPDDLAAFDALDALLEDESLTLRFKLAKGDMVFLDNTTVAHDRDAYVDDPGAPRHLLRLWLDGA